MIKKAIFLGVALVAGSLFFIGRDAASYVSTSMGWVKDSVKSSVPISFEIDRARRMVQNLRPEIRKNMHLIAREEADLEQLAKRIGNSTSRLDVDKANIMKLQGDLVDDRDVFHYTGRSYTREQVQTDMANRFARYQTAESTLESLREIHHQRQSGLEAHRNKLQNMLSTKRQLEVEIEELQTQHKMLEAVQAGCDYSIDDSRLSRVKQLIGDLRTRLEVAAKMVDAESDFHDEIPLSEPTPENIVERVAEYFGNADAVEIGKLADARP